jgi:hypothetical protein
VEAVDVQILEFLQLSCSMPPMTGLINALDYSEMVQYILAVGKLPLTELSKDVGRKRHPEYLPAITCNPLALFDPVLGQLN